MVGQSQVYRDSAGHLFEAPASMGQSGDSTAPIGTPTVSKTYGLARAVDGFNPTVVSAGPTMLMNIEGYNARNGGVTVELFDQTTLPSPADTPRWSVYIPGITSGGRDWPTGLQFASGLAFSLVPDDAPGLMAGDILALNLGYSS